VDQAVIDSADAVVNLSGEPIAHWPPTESWRRELVRSRLSATETLVRAISAAPTPPVLLSASGAGYYGPDRGDEALTESSAPGAGFIPQLVVDWEASALAAASAGSRVVLLRTGLPLHRSGGVMKPMLPAFKLGLGAKLGDGAQYFPVVSLTDWCRAVEHVLSTDFSGPVNIALPEAPTNAEFTDALGRALHRPTVVRVPATPVKLALGSLASAVLGSLRLRPQALLDAGFEFGHPTLEEVVKAAL
jgi:hypothetical protein